MTQATFDVAVIGAGAVGCAVARELCVHGLQVVLLEARDDVGAGTSKANTAIWHTGFDAKPGTLEARLVARGHHLLNERAATSGWPLQRTGAVLVAWTDDELAALPGIVANAGAAGYDAIVELTAQQVYDREPNLGPGVQGGLLVPDEGLLDPWAITLGLATEALLNGAQVWRGCAVTGAARSASGYVLQTSRGDVHTRWVVDAAGLSSGTVDGWFRPDAVSVQPRRGQLLVFDKLAARLISHVVLPVPTATTKGVLVAPTVYGNVLLGPTAEDVEQRYATQTTSDGLAFLLRHGRRILPALLDEEVTATYAGARAATDHGDYLYAVIPEEQYVRLAGIRSTGITSCLALAEQVVHDLADAGEPLQQQPANTYRVPDLSETALRPYLDETLIASDAQYGEIVCHCERVTRGELRDALASPLPPVSTDGLKRRTRALMGRCQGFYCAARVRHLLGTGARG